MAGVSISNWIIPPKPRLRGAKADSLSALSLLILLSLLLLSCGAGQRPADAGPRGTLRIDGEPATAIVEVDEKRLGPVGMFAEKGLLLKPGQHRVIVRAEGYFPAYELVDVKEDEVTVLEVSLRPVPE